MAQCYFPARRAVGKESVRPRPHLPFLSVPPMPSRPAQRARTILTATCLAIAGTLGAARAQALAISTHDVLAVEDARLSWHHDDQFVELVATGDGLLVTQASAGSSLGLQRGDRIHTVGHAQITAVAHLIAALRAAAAHPVVVHVLRDGVQIRLTWTAAAYTALLPPGQATLSPHR